VRILAFNIAHDSAVCSINNGTIEFFCKEERLSRIKRDMHPFKSLDLYKSMNFDTVDHVLYHTPTNNNSSFEVVYTHYIRKMFDKKLENFSNLTHHLCHASLAFYNSGFSECLTFVIDRNGSIFFLDNDAAATEAESVFQCSYPNNIKPLYKSFSAKSNYSFNKADLKNKIQQYYVGTSISLHDSLGIVKVYEAATTLIGQHPLENGKTMGLSAYSKSQNYNSFFINDNPISNYFSLTDTEHMKDVVCFNNLYDKTTSTVTTENYQFYADKAQNVQLETQQAALNLIKKSVELTGIKNVCIVGGYGLNVVANNFYIENLPDVNFYFEPLADDTGISIGAAMLKYRTETQDSVIRPIKDTFYQYYNKDENITQGKSSSIDELTDILISQKSLGIVNGAPEAGPRALGNRSILFDPRNINSKDIVNRIKKREWYRPFAGIILKDKINDFFVTNNINDYSFMTVSLKATQLAKNTVPGIIHVDNTCRIQTVSEGFIFELLTEFYKKTGCPMLLNTSLNLAGEPLVQTKQDALNILDNSALDYVYFVEDDKLVKNKEI
jgi:carbamoyltransferase